MAVGPHPPPASPTDEEVAAILAAVELVWPRAVSRGPKPPEARSHWRFSGRWWLASNLPVAARRVRPG